MSSPRPRETPALPYVVVEGVIGVGKTTLVEQLTRALGGRSLLEAFETNPFLPSFYEDRTSHALATQLFFLMSRFRQQEVYAQPDLFRPITVADYSFDKDRIFAEINLSPAEMRIYDRLYEVLQPRVPTPDLVIRLRADLDALLARIRARGRSFEAEIDPGYLRDLSTAYDAYFDSYSAAPVVTVQTDRTDLSLESPAFRALLSAITTGEVPTRIDERGADADPELPGLPG